MLLGSLVIVSLLGRSSSTTTIWKRKAHMCTPPQAHGVWIHA